MSNTQKRRIIPIYSSKGDADAFLYYPYIFNRLGDWIGWVTEEREVYSVLGNYVGYLTNEPRILRTRTTRTTKPRLNPPPPPPVKIYPSATVPLAPLMPELSFSQVDVLQDEPERLHAPDSGDLRPDMD